LFFYFHYPFFKIAANVRIFEPQGDPAVYFM